MAEIIEYKVVRLQGPEVELENQLNDQGAGLWILATFLHEAAPGAGPYLAIFYKKTAAVVNVPQ